MGYKLFTRGRRSIRLPGYDYSQAGAYFVTVCSANRECLFGEIANGEMYVHEFGEVVLKLWDTLADDYPYVELDEFVVMPNHIHGIVVITSGGTSLPSADEAQDASIRKRTLGQLMGHFKFQCTKEINRIRDTGYAKVLQRGYYEHIIRNEREWSIIAQYIRDNPAKWSADFDNPANLANRPLPRTDHDYWRDAGLL